MTDVISIAIDGPGGAGKSSVAKAVARNLDAMYLDTGAMYRATALYMARLGVPLEDAAAVIASLAGMPLSVAYIGGAQHTFLADEDVTQEVRSQQISKAASVVSAIAEVRAHLVDMQRQIARGQSVVMDGRDIGTKVLPGATMKIFLTAPAEIRAQRRWEEMRQKGVDARFEDVLRDLTERDYDDIHRAASPLIRAEDAIEVDTSTMNLDEVIAHITALALERIGGIA